MIRHPALIGGFRATRAAQALVLGLMLLFGFAHAADLRTLVDRFGHGTAELSVVNGQSRHGSVNAAAEQTDDRAVQGVASSRRSFPLADAWEALPAPRTSLGGAAGAIAGAVLVLVVGLLVGPALGPAIARRAFVERVVIGARRWHRTVVLLI